MTSKVLLCALAGITAIGVVAATQDPSFEYPAAKHVGFDVTKPEEGSQAPAQRSDKVSVTFQNASIREILDWLKNQGVSFVVEEGQLDQDAKASVHVVDQPIESVMNALASAWGGRWENRNGIWVYRGRAFDFMPMLAAPRAVVPPNPKVAAPKAEAGKVAPPMLVPALPGKTWTFSSAPMTQAEREALRKSIAEMQDSKKWQEFEKSMQAWSKDLAKSLKDKQLQDAKAQDELRIHLKDLAKDGRFRVWTNGEGVPSPMMEKQISELRKQAEEMAKSAQKMRIEFKDFDGKHFFDEKSLPKLAPGKAFVLPPRTTVGFSSSHLKAIWDSLTPAQSQILKTKGYLNYSDLNADQRRQLGVITDDSWTISYKTDKVDLTIKSDR